ncbi:MAG: vWA domain-containing protein [Planctomycetota bacterium]
MCHWYLTAAATLAMAAGQASASGLKVVVIVDNSGSMQTLMRGAGNRINAAKQALQTVLDQTPDDAEVGVLLLNPVAGRDWLIPLGPVDKQSTRAAIDRLDARGPTPLGAGMKTAVDALLKSREENRYGTYKLLVVTDGEASDPDVLERFLPEIAKRGLLLDTIGVAMGQQHSLAARSNTYRSADDPASLEQAISEVVLGESSTDGGAAGESDFEWLEGLPSEVAAASLAALASPVNTPIGAPPAADVAANNQPAPFGGNPPVAAAPPQAEPESGFPTGLVVFGVILFVIVRFISSLGKSS